MGKRAKIVTEIKHTLPGWKTDRAFVFLRAPDGHGPPPARLAGRDPGRLDSVAEGPPRGRRRQDRHPLLLHVDATLAGKHLSVALGQLPEMHVWVGIIDSQELVDFSTRHLPVGCLGAPDDLDGSEAAEILMVPGESDTGLGCLPARP